VSVANGNVTLVVAAAKGRGDYTWTFLEADEQQTAGVSMLPWEHMVLVKPELLLEWNTAPDYEKTLFGTFHNGNAEEEVANINMAIAAFKAAVRTVTVEEWRMFRKLLLLAKLHGGSRGVDALWKTAAEQGGKYSPPPDFGRAEWSMPKTRFKQIRKFCVYAFASADEIFCAAAWHQKKAGSTAQRTHDMMVQRRRNLQQRRLFMVTPRRLIADERQLGWVPRVDRASGNPHMHYCERKPTDRIGRQATNVADPDHHVELGYEPVDDPEAMRLRKWDSEYGERVSTSLRMMELAGATKDNRGNYFCDSWFTSMALIEAAAVEFPKWSITGVVKHNGAATHTPPLHTHTHPETGPGQRRPPRSGFRTVRVPARPHPPRWFQHVRTDKDSDC